MRRAAEPVRSRPSAFVRDRLRLLFALAAVVLPLAGCGSSDRQPTTRPASAYQRQEEALKDPFGYSPMDKPNISGGGLSEYDKKAMKRDIDHVLNP